MGLLGGDQAQLLDRLAAPADRDGAQSVRWRASAPGWRQRAAQNRDGSDIDLLVDFPASPSFEPSMDLNLALEEGALANRP